MNSLRIKPHQDATPILCRYDNLAIELAKRNFAYSDRMRASENTALRWAWLGSVAMGAANGVRTSLRLLYKKKWRLEHWLRCACANFTRSPLACRPGPAEMLAPKCRWSRSQVVVGQHPRVPRGLAEPHADLELLGHHRQAFSQWYLDIHHPCAREACTYAYRGDGRTETREGRRKGSVPGLSVSNATMRCMALWCQGDSYGRESDISSHRRLPVYRILRL